VTTATLEAVLALANGTSAARKPDARLVRRIEIHGVSAEIIAPRSLAPSLAIMLRAYPTAPSVSEPDIRITVTRDGANWRVAAPSFSYSENGGAGAAARRVEWCLISEAVRLWTGMIHVHAALVATADRSALLIGPSGRGKSTTSMALALAGLSLYTDDVALIDRETLRPLCVPRPVKLDYLARRLLADRGLAIPRGRILGECIDRTILPGLPPIDEPGPPIVAAIFFSKERARQAEARPLTSAEALMYLIRQSVSERIDKSGVSDGALALISAVRCYELVPGNLDSTIQAVLTLMDAPGKSAAVSHGLPLPDVVATNGTADGAHRLIARQT